ncbi:MAG: DUF4215 domain-containing protein [Deltaproteobacteria bacterium]|nr:DUF4215 domain-containing protein [Deltaproteobacteria bacterium]
MRNIFVLIWMMTLFVFTFLAGCSDDLSEENENDSDSINDSDTDSRGVNPDTTGISTDSDTITVTPSCPKGEFYWDGSLASKKNTDTDTQNIDADTQVADTNNYSPNSCIPCVCGQEGSENAGMCAWDSPFMSEGACDQCADYCYALTGMCGDGVVSGPEKCDDGVDTDNNKITGAGCSDICEVETDIIYDSEDRPRYWICPAEEDWVCRRTQCGDGVVEGDEACDTGSNMPGSGCSPTCKMEPVCVDGECSSRCGDGMILPGDTYECDDGNNIDNDGCSSECKIEKGWQCELETEALPDKLLVPIVYRDFIYGNSSNTDLAHPDFQIYSGQGTAGLVENKLKNGIPVASGNCLGAPGGAASDCLFGNQFYSAESFAEWYTGTPGQNYGTPDYVEWHPAYTVLKNLCLARQDGSDDVYMFDSRNMDPYTCEPSTVNSFVPLAGDENGGWHTTDVSGTNSSGGAFTSVVTTWFEFKGGEELTFSGDDDVWVFIKNTLVLDLGGMHSRLEGTLTLNADGTSTGVSIGTLEVNLGLEKGQLYELKVFHAERMFGASNYMLTLNGFQSSQTSCNSVCGDGIVIGEEECDHGDNNVEGDPGYDECSVECKMGPYCGDSILNGDEQCDEGYNNGSGTSTCSANCLNKDKGIIID